MMYCVIWSKLFNVSVPLFPPLWKGCKSVVLVLVFFYFPLFFPLEAREINKLLKVSKERQYFLLDLLT